MRPTRKCSAHILGVIVLGIVGHRGLRYSPLRSAWGESVRVRIRKMSSGIFRFTAVCRAASLGKALHCFARIGTARGSAGEPAGPFMVGNGLLKLGFAA
ncbi:MAG: hypothetical protein Q7R93_01590 [bacterium]|nr:hypothetical protein [bacterium]